ncbi:MAG: hypothetical protein Q8K99_05460 [Actinomycetota bacterium]|nr:hypothetical protein [Actinomycetota bacterium]
MSIPKRIAETLLVVALAALVVSGCSSPTASEQSDQPLTAQATDTPAAIPRGANTEFLPRALFTSENFGSQEWARLDERFGVECVFPTSAIGGELEGVYVPDPLPGEPPGFLVVYASDTVVSVTRQVNESTAEAVVRGRGSPTGFEKYVTRHDIDGATAYAVPRLSIPPEADPEAEPWKSDGSLTVYPAKPGTGLSTSAALVVWHHGPFALTVASPVADVDDLVEFASSIDFSAIANAR